MKKKKRRRVHKVRPAGIFNDDAPFWRGERAEHIVKKRVATYKKKRPSKRRQKK